MLEIWRSLAGQRGLLQPMSIDVLEQFVMSRLYFDPRGLWLAWEEDRVLGMAHAGFGPTEDQGGIQTDTGTICVLLVRPDCNREEVAAGLLRRCEEYLLERGTSTVYGGGLRPLNPFYLGLYGGSELPGILVSDALACAAFAAQGYCEAERTTIFHCDLHKFHAPVSRRHMQIRRQMLVHTVPDPPLRSWWEACTLGNFDLTLFTLCPNQGGPPVAHALVRNMEPTAAFGVGRSVGLLELEVDPSHRRHGLVTFLLTEVFHQLSRQGVAKVEVQVMTTNTAAVSLYRRLGFQEIDEGIVFRKETASPSMSEPSFVKERSSGPPITSAS